MTAIEQIRSKAAFCLRMTALVILILLVPIGGFLLGVYFQLRLIRELCKLLFAA